MNKSFFALLLLLVLFQFACKKNEIDATYKGENQLIIGGDYWANNSARDSVVFSFAEYDLTTTEGFVTINVQISGEVADIDRPFKLAIDTPQSTALPAEFEIPGDLFIPAGQVKTAVPIKVKRTPRLLTEYAMIILKVLPNEHFKPGTLTPVNTVIASNLNPIVINYGPTFKILWTDVLTKPPTWDAAGTGISFAVGQWSMVKHQLIIDATGIRSFMSLTSPQKYALGSQAAAYLAAYNTAHPGNPLQNENGVIIGICSGCP